MLDKLGPVVDIASSVGHCIRTRLSLRVLFLLTFLCLVTSIIYIHNIRVCRQIPTSPDLCKLWDVESSRQNATLWWQWACLIERDMDSQQGYQCEHLDLMGNWPVCWDERYKPRKPCLVYSFGIDNDFSFDDAMAEKGCTVYSFDPSMGQTDHKHSERVFFKNMGLGSVDTDTFHPKFDVYVKHTQNWKMRTLKSIMSILGHEQRHIDVLKIDIEAYEWEVVANIIKDGLFPRIRQFLVEWHIFPNEPFRNKFQDMYEAYMGLRKNGLEFYYKFSQARYHHYSFFNSGADMCYVNTKFKDAS